MYRVKSLKINLEQRFDWLEARWRMLPIGKQRSFVLYFFTVYLLLTAGVIFSVWNDVTRPDRKMVIEHIENPVIKKDGYTSPQDTLVTIKNNIYEGK